MLQQSLPLHSITAAAAAMCQDLRQAAGHDLLDVQLPVSVVLYELMQRAGVPGNAIRMVLTASELDDIGDQSEPGQPVARCAVCGDEATKLVDGRRGRLLLCDCHAEVYERH